MTAAGSLYRCAVVLAVAGCSAGPASSAGPPRFVGSAIDSSATLPLSRFMREQVNVPFAFAFLESSGANRPVRVRKAAVVLNAAARHLVEWKNPPVESDAGREVFFEYARHLERSADRLEQAILSHDYDAAASNLDGIRRTCNSCHRFFRPANLTNDVGYDLSKFQGGAGPW